MECSLSRKVPVVPVVSKTSGLIFEKKLIERYILDNGKCPITGDPLTMADILPLRTWKASALTSAVNDSSSTVKDFQSSPVAESLPQLSDRIIKDIDYFGRNVGYCRIYRKIPASLIPMDTIESYIVHKYSLPETSSPGILSLDIDTSKNIIATGDVDSTATVLDLTGAESSRLIGHSKQVTSVKLVKDGKLVVTGSADKTVRVWEKSMCGAYDCQHILKDHTDEVQAVTVHPTQNYFVTASLDCTWQLYEVSPDSGVTRVACAVGSEKCTSAAFHPDGRILGTGTSGLLRLWDVSSQDIIVKLDAHDTEVTSISFSEDGYLLATASRDDVKLWDLRFLQKLEFLGEDHEIKPTHSVDFDHSGSYLVAGGSFVSVYKIDPPHDCQYKKSFTCFPGTVNYAKFSRDAENIVAWSGVDPNLILLGLPGDSSMET